MSATLTSFLLLLKQNKVAHNGDWRKGGAMGSSPQQVQGTWPPLSHTYQAVSSGLVRSENEMAARIECLPTRSWKQKSNKVEAEGEEGGVWGEGLLLPLHLCSSYIQSLDVKSYLCYFASNNHAPLRFRDGIWVMNTEHSSIVLPFICAEEPLLSVCRWDRKVPREG